LEFTKDDKTSVMLKERKYYKSKRNLADPDLLNLLKILRTPQHCQKSWVGNPRPERIERFIEDQAFNLHHSGFEYEKLNSPERIK